MKLVKLKNSELEALIDDEKEVTVSLYDWTLKGKYAFMSRRGKWISMANFIMGSPPESFIWDHFDHNTLNNQVENLKLATREQNQANRLKSKNNTSGYKNVSYRGACIIRPWRVKLLRSGTTYQFHYRTIEEAVVAADLLALKLDGDFAYLNLDKSNYKKDESGNWSMNSQSKIGTI